MAQFFKPKAASHAALTSPVTVQIDRFDHQGRGMAKVKGKTLFVAGALPGETVVASIEQEKKEYAKGQVIKVVSASSQRQVPVCPHYQICGGCDLQHLEGHHQQQYKAQSLLALVAKFARVRDIQLSPTLFGDPLGYRRSARFGLQFNKKQRRLEMSFRRKSSNQLFKQTCCPVLAPQLDTLIEPVHQLLQQLSIVEKLGHIAFYLAEQGPALLLRHLKPLTKADEQRLVTFAQQHHVLWFLQGNDNQIQALHHQICLNYALPQWQLKIDFAPNNFIQVNDQVNQKMIAQALEWLDVQPEDRVIDLFAGLGNFSLPLATLAKQVVGVEGIDTMVEQANRNAEQAGLANLNFYQADLSNDFSQQPWAKEAFNKALLDPARDGALFVTEHLAKLNCERIVYVSCHPATMARDAQVLIERGYQLTKLGLVDMFPNTAHMESMALFQRKKRT
ncbi:23S rRNA (uracil(1939)-C(5))-methyltransferase RlmD [Motilimonas sp. 1_MG-2023]|uniref:23S rRNA (uracil(1939)-C(5))-methyltransferase RlmD n=1 Tax=Motilimonas sp. 1_MG-2023 TaxID=3062672 RepID=UPI0026E200AD|nr:23S rRNA (uracil(1939)-C(5))-methyltransferase RlmD [Motilimonas sp. 1_MG-2023]MDO6527666.1 23S rRNA (uracil(1939)-C(5))-methyltransferase RlmD [Motilimonas sp. 1_MG-2023]